MFKHQDNCIPPAVLEPCSKDCPTLFHIVALPAAMGDDKTNPPRNGQYRNTLLVYEANHAAYLYDSAGVWMKLPSPIVNYDKLTHKPRINGIELVGDVTLEELGIAGLIADEAEAREQADRTLQENIGIEEAARIAADEAVIGRIPTVNNATLTIQRNGSQVATFTANSASNVTANISVPTSTSDLVNDSNFATTSDVSSAVAVETGNRESADSGLQRQIDAIAASSDVVDIVGTYTDLQNYDTTKLHDNDIIKVLDDSTHNDATAYYRWHTNTSTFTYIGSEGPFYTKSEADAEFVPQTRTVNNKPLSSNIALTASDVGALPDSTVIPTVNDATLTIQKNGTDIATFTANSSTNTTANISVPTKTSDLTNNGADNTSTYVEADELATVATSGSYNDLLDKPTIPGNMVVLSYGNSTWNDFITAYNDNRIVYCRASSNANPGTGTQGRMAFMAYLNNPTAPTSVEFQYVRSVSSKSASQQGDQVYVYTLTNTNGGTWSVVTREMSTKIVAGTNMSSSYSSGTLTLSATVPTKTSDLTNDGADNTSTYVEADELAAVATSGNYSDLSGTPTIPTVNDATLTIQRNGVNVDTFTANASVDKTINITVPTATSDLNNDSGFLTSIPVASANDLGGVKVGTGLAIDANGVLSATGSTSSVAWNDITGKPNFATVATSGSYSDLSNKPTIPEIKSRTGASTVADFSPLYVAGTGTTALPMALQTHGDSHSGSFAYVNINEPTNNISEAYVGGYVWDEYESWWRKMTEVKLALYSDIPTVNDATLTIQRNSVTVDTFTANASTNKSINIVVPTATSDLNNDSGFITGITKITNAEIDAIMGVS